MHQMISANFLRICPTFYVFTFLSQSILPECFTASVTFTIFSKSLFISLNFISHFFFLRFFFLSLLLLFFLNFNNYHDVFVLLFFSSSFCCIYLFCCSRHHFLRFAFRLNSLLWFFIKINQF